MIPSSLRQFGFLRQFWYLTTVYINTVHKDLIGTFECLLGMHLAQWYIYFEESAAALPVAISGFLQRWGMGGTVG